MRSSKVQDVYALSPLQAGMLFHTIYAPEAAVYLDQHVYTLHGDLDASAFEGAWQYLVERHAVLRTSFHWEGLKEPLQVVHESIQVPVDHLDWRGLSNEEQQAALAALRKKDRERGIDLSQAPLLRLTLVRTAADTWQFLWTIHHILVDRWSVSQVISEFATAYEALCQ